MLTVHKSYSVLGLPVHIMTNYIDWLLDEIKQGRGSHVITLNAEMTIQAEKDPALAKVIKNAELVIPDGSGVVLYVRYLLRQKVERLPGIELAENLIQATAKQAKPAKIFFYGGGVGVAATASQLWQKQLPNLNIIGTHSGYHSLEEEQQLLQTLAQTKPEVILVGLGVPKQELWIAKNRHLCPHATWIGVGGSFDIWSGKKTRAPQWLANNHLEWLYRLYQEPWRWRRMLALPEFACKSVIHRLRDIL